MNWISALQRVNRANQPYVLVSILDVKGSSPREAGCKMVVTEAENYDTIGGGHLEFKAVEIAREMLLENRNQQRMEDFPLGPRLGQCCGGKVTLLLEAYCDKRIEVMLFGAGHVGQALAGILSQLPINLTWVDARQEFVPKYNLPNTRFLLSDEPQYDVKEMPADAYYVVMTHNHPMDLAICEKVLERGNFAYLGVIGSRSKSVRFRNRLLHKGYDEALVERMRCPMGLTDVPGKRPMEVAVSVAGELVAHYQAAAHRQEDLPAAPPVALGAVQ